MEEKMIARYKILGRLGAGGMGEVFKALDTKMRREVALKLLPAHYVSDPERVARFKHEALATSALNHPNITTIFEIDEADGQHYISLEYIAGRSLRELLRAEPLDLRQILDITIQVAEGLHAAHEAGVVHRDLKPENVMVRPDGITKILDFGLAKLGGAHEVPSASDETLVQGSPGSQGLTQPGVVLGTVAYMSPEQARGQTVDRRSDIFTLGTMLLEMLTGAQPFKGPSAVEVMHAIIHDTPPALQHLSASVPAELVRIVRKAVAKNPSERYQTAKDIAIDLRTLQRDVDSGAVSSVVPAASGTVPAGTPGSGTVLAGASPGPWGAAPASGMTAAPSGAVGTGGAATSGGAAVGGASAGWPGASIPGMTPARARRRAVVVRVAVGGLVVALALALVVVFMQRGAQTPAPAQAPVMQMKKLTDTGNAGSPVLGPNGQFVAYTNTDTQKDLVSIRIRQVVTGTEVEVVPGQPDVSLGYLAFSPDGNWLLYTTRQRRETTRTLWQVSPLGGPAREVLRDVDSAPSFSPDGKQFIFHRGLGPLDIRFYIASFGSSGEPKEVYAAPKEALIVALPIWSPDGNEILYQQIDRSDLLHKKLMTKNLQTGAMRAVPGEGWMQLTGYEWARDGKGAYVTGSRSWGNHDQIWYVRLDDGTVRPVTQGFDDYSGVDVRRDGKALVSVRSTVSSQLWNVPVLGSAETNAAQARQITRGTMLIGNPRVSPDGKQVAVTAEVGGGMAVHVMAADGSNLRRLTFGATTDFWQAWSPDGQRLAYASEREGNLQIWVIDTNGQNGRQLTHVGTTNYAPSWSPDGQWLAFIASHGDSSILYKIPAAGGEPVRMSGGERVMMLTEWSPDGRWILTWIQPSKPSAQFDAGLFPADGAGEVRRVPFTPRSQFTLLSLRWTPDGRALSAVEQAEAAWGIRVYPLDGSASRSLVTFTGDEILFSYGWSRDGRFIIAQRGTISSDVLLLESTP